MPLARPPSEPESILTSRHAFVGVASLFGLWLLWSFLPALAWGVVLAIAVEPVVHIARRRFGPGRDTAIAAVITLVFLLVLVIPLVVGVSQAGREAGQLHEALRQARHQGMPPPPWVSSLPAVGTWLSQWWLDHFGTPEATAEALTRVNPSHWLAQTRTLGADLIHRLALLGFAGLTLFLLLRHRDAVVDQLRLAGDRLLGATARRIGDQAVASIRGTIDGLVLVGLGEGAVMTVVYLLLGVPHPILLGLVTAIAAIIPFGAALAFGLAALLLLIQGSAGAALAVVIVGLAVVGIADHLVRPALIGGATRLPFLWVLLGILGGVERLGLIGLFVGPATMAVLHLLWQDYVSQARCRRPEADAAPPVTLPGA